MCTLIQKGEKMCELAVASWCSCDSDAPACHALSPLSSSSMPQLAVTTLTSLQKSSRLSPPLESKLLAPTKTKEKYPCDEAYAQHEYGAEPNPWRRAAAIENTHPTMGKKSYTTQSCATRWVDLIHPKFTNLALLWSSHDLIHPKFPTHLSIWLFTWTRAHGCAYFKPSEILDTGEIFLCQAWLPVGIGRLNLVQARGPFRWALSVRFRCPGEIRKKQTRRSGQALSKGPTRRLSLSTVNSATSVWHDMIYDLSMDPSEMSCSAGYITPAKKRAYV
jgi:hypothetical protein